MKFLQVHVGYTNCSDNQFTTVFLNDFHVGVVWYIKVYNVKKTLLMLGKIYNGRCFVRLCVYFSVLCEEVR